MLQEILIRFFYLTDNEADKVQDFISDVIPDYEKREMAYNQKNQKDKAAFSAAFVSCVRCGATMLIIGNTEINGCPHCGEYSEVLDYQLLEETDEYHFDFTGNIPDVAQALYCEIRDFLNSKK